MCQGLHPHIFVWLERTLVHNYTTVTDGQTLPQTSTASSKQCLLRQETMLCPMKLILSLRGTKTVFLSSPLRILLMNHFHSAGQWDLCTMNIFHWHLSLNCSSLQKMKGKGLDRLCSIQLARDSGRARLLVLGRGRGKLLRHISISLSHIPVELHQSRLHVVQ